MRQPVCLLLFCCACSAWQFATSVGPSVHVRRQRTHVRLMAGAAGTAAGGGGDLEGGGDSSRNAQVESLRKMFVAPAAETETEPASSAADKEDARKLGLFLDMPLCRYSWCILPHHQIAMSVWQPQYTLMFNKLLGEPGPHYYFHVLLPGGAESLGQPGYELEPGTKSSLSGTLVRIVYAQRNADSTLTLIVQGLARGVVLRGTQTLPYSRGDVQLLPDAEALLAAARSTERYLKQMVATAARDAANDADSGVPRAADATGTTSRSVKRRLVAAAAAAETEAYFGYEAMWMSVDAGGNLAALNQLNTSAAPSLATAPSAMRKALSATPLPPSDDSAEDDTLYAGSVAATLLDTALTVAEADAGSVVAEVAAEVAEQAEEAEAVDTLEVEMLEVLETQVWIELDDLLQATRDLLPSDLPSRREVPVPSQLLGLLPEPSTGSTWPDDFLLGGIAARLRLEVQAAEAAEAAKAEGTDRAKPAELREMVIVVPDPAYPPRKRVERLSWLIWSVVGDQKVGVNSFGGSPYQELIEAEGTAERLRKALLKIREIKAQVAR